jgi:hypothetical protein
MPKGEKMRERLIELLGETPGIGWSPSAREMVADHLLANGVTVQRWIPVTERLPSKEEYTAKAEDGTEYYVRLLIAYKTDIVEYEIGYYDGYKWMTEMPIRLIKDVVAWMPFPNMPQPPMEEHDYKKRYWVETVGDRKSSSKRRFYIYNQRREDKQ